MNNAFDNEFLLLEVRSSLWSLLGPMDGLEGDAAASVLQVMQ